MRTLNLGILAHVDAGKTSLTERLLYAAGVIDAIGSVDAGTTQTDSLVLERQRGITIKSAVASFVIDDVTVNLIDTPGHPDFIAEVERVLSVLDGAVLVVSAVEGVQPQTRVLMRTLRRLRIPTLIFVNKIDRGGAGYGRVLQAVSARLTPAIVPMGSVGGAGTRQARFAPYASADEAFVARLVDVLTDHDDALLAAYVDDAKAVSYRRLRRELAAQVRAARVHPVFFGSAVTGAGVPCLTDGISEFLPTHAGGADRPASGSVFKIERGPGGEPIAYVRMFAGTVGVRDRVRFGDGREGKVTAVSVYGSDPAAAGPLVAGQIGRVWGLGGVRIGDAIGVPRPATSQRRHFAPPSLEAVVVALPGTDHAALHSALTLLAEQDPLINLRRDDVRQQISVSLYGEVQKEVIQATLANEFGVQVTFDATTTICIERPVGTGAAAEMIGTEANPFLATVGLRIEPGPVNSGVQFRLGVELGSMPFAFIRAVDETVRETLRQGVHGWAVTDCLVTMTHSGYWARQSHAHGTFDKSMSSTAGDFRNLTPLVVMSALTRAGTTVYEPMHRLRLELPPEALGPALTVLARLRAVPDSPALHGSLCTVAGEIPAEHVNELRQLLPGLTRGEGVLESVFDRYQPVRGAIPSRPRSDHNPLNRDEYLLRVVRRVPGR